MRTHASSRSGATPPQSRGPIRWHVLTAVLPLLAILASCKEHTKPCAVTAVSVSPSAAALAVGSSQQLAASATATDCTAAEKSTVTWTTSAAGVATVSSTGLVNAVAPGTATILGAVAGASGSSTITVSPAPIAAISITPAATSVIVGQSTTLSAVATDAQGGTLSGRTFTWTSLVPSIATVSSSGLVVGLSVGSATITAVAEGRTAIAVVTVTPAPVASVGVVLGVTSLRPGQTTQAIATATDAQGTSLTGRAVSWQSSNAAVASVDAFGVVTATSPGSTNISATSEGKSGSATLTVTQVPVASVSMAVNSATMRVGDTQIASASARDANGVALTGRSMSWTSSNPSVASVTQGGVITAVAVGSVAISASSEGQFSSAAITVTPNVASVALTVPVTTIVVGQQSQAAALAKDGSGTTVTGVLITYSSSNLSAATITSNGAITAISPGTTTITAAVGAVTASAQLTVTPVLIPVASVVLSATSGSVQVGRSLQLTATPKDAGGATLTDRVATWSSTATAVAAVSSGGLVVGLAPGTATIRATIEGITSSAVISVNVVPVGTVAISVPSNTVSVGNALQASVTVKDQNNDVVSRPVTYGSSNNSVASVSQGGLITAVSAGNATISATSEGQSGTVALTVLGTPTLSIVSISPSNSGADVSIEGQVIITFSENINAATVSASSVALTKSGVAVAATRTVSGKVVTLTPSALLDEFTTSYSTSVTTALRSSVGNQLPANSSLSFSTVFWDPSYYYRLTNDYRGASESLDSYPDGTYNCFMGPTGNYSGQAWYFLPIVGSGGYYTMQNAYGGPTRALEGAASPGQCFLTGPFIPGQYTGMMWRAASAAAYSPGRYFLQNWGSSAKSLDTPLYNGIPWPSMQTTGGFSGQFWSFTRLSHR